MAKSQKIYKVNIDEITKALAIASVKGEKETVSHVSAFLNAFGIPVDNNTVKAQVKEFEEIKKLFS